MLYKIAELNVYLPGSGGMKSRARDYLYQGDEIVEVEISEEKYNPVFYPDCFREEDVAYMSSGSQFYRALIDFNGLMLHSSAVALDGKAYLFSGPCGRGKSTHTRLYQQIWGDEVKNFNDDKPALRRLDDKWYAYGTPWCGKDGININMKVPLAGICFLEKGDKNEIQRLSEKEAVTKILSQTLHKIGNPAKLCLLLDHIEKLVKEIPVYQLTNKPEPDAARLSYETMRRGAEEAGL
ncbi:MAG: hypothetical protein IKU44_00905 [Firmicutes bacterium]|nr:hypothetical protein [Bacillota bacterium]